MQIRKRVQTEYLPLVSFFVCVLCSGRQCAPHTMHRNSATPLKVIFTLIQILKSYPELRDPRAWVTQQCELVSEEWNMPTMSELWDTQRKRPQEGKLLQYHPSCSQFSLHCKAQTFSNTQPHLYLSSCIQPSPKMLAFLNFSALLHMPNHNPPDWIFGVLLNYFLTNIVYQWDAIPTL